MPSRRIWVVALMLAAACGGDEPSLGSKDLARIMPSGADAPAGTTLQTSTSGPKTLQEFVTDAAVRAELERLGFRVGYVAGFATANLGTDLAAAPAGAALYSATAVILRDADAAKGGLIFYKARLTARAKGFTPVVAAQFGAEAVAFRFVSLEDTPLPGLAYVWRVGNTLFSVVGVGNPPLAEAIRGLASAIDRRAYPDRG